MIKALGKELPEENEAAGLPDAEAAKSPELLWLSCGTNDRLLGTSQGVHRRLQELAVPHLWHITDGAHDPAEWKQAL